MNTSLYDSKFTDAMPDILAREPWLQAIDRVVQRRVQKWMDEDAYLQIYVRIRELPEWILDAMAPNVRAETYRETDDIETKRDKIELALWGYNIKGTVMATEMLTEAVFGAGRAKVEEWFDYDDDPGYFQVVNYNLGATDEMLNDFIDRMDGYKRLSIWLRRFLTVITAPRQDLHMGIAMAQTRRTWMFMLPGMNFVPRLAMCRIRRTMLIMDCRRATE